MELMQKATSVAMLVFVVSSMLAMGVGLTIGQIITPLRNRRLIVLALLGNFVLMPLGAVFSPQCFDSTNRWEWVCCCLVRQPVRPFCRSWLK